MLRNHCICCWQKNEGRIWFDIIGFKFYWFERITWWCLTVLEFILKPVMEFALQLYFLLEKKLKISGSPKICVKPTSSERPLCRTPCRLFIHEAFFEPLGLHLGVWSELGRSPPFWPMKALRLQWSRAFSLVCEVALIRVFINTKLQVLLMSPCTLGVPYVPVHSLHQWRTNTISRARKEQTAK